MKMNRMLSVAVVIAILLNLFTATAFAEDAEELTDSNTGFTDTTVLDEREYTDLDKRQEATPTVVEEKVDQEFATGRIADGTSIHEERFLEDSYLKGTSDRMETTFSVGEWLVKDVQLTLVYSASQFIDNTKSSFTVLVNGVRCVTEAQPSTYGERSQIKLTLPSSELKLGINTLAIEADILTTGTAPDTAGSIASGWFNVFKDSTIALAYEPLNQVTTIKEFYKKFISMESLDFKHSAVALPKNPTDLELESAIRAMAGISQNTEKYFQNIELAAADNLSELSGYKNILYIAGYDTLPPDIKNLLLDWHKARAENGAVVALVKSGTQNILVVTGKDEAALSNATRMLASDEMMMQMNFTSRSVLAGEGFELIPEPFEQYRQLTPTGTRLEGEAVQSANYYIEFPYNRSITDESQLYLVFRYGDNLDYERSLMTVYINETPVASKRLSSGGAARDEVTFYIPTDIAVTGNFVLRVAFDLRLGAGGGAAPWAFVSPESTLKINSASQPFLVFENYPSPFIKDGIFNELLVVLPQVPSPADLTILGQTSLLFGQYMESVGGNLTVVRDGDIFDIKGKNVISIGSYGSNNYTQSLNKSLFFQFSEDASYLLSNEKMVLDPTFSKDAGTVQLLESPSDKDNAILVVTGATDTGMQEAASYLRTPDYAWKVFGDGFITDMEKIYNFKFKDDNVKSLSVPSKLRMREDLTLLLIVLAMLTLIAILSLVFLAVRYRKGGTYNEKQ